MLTTIEQTCNINTLLLKYRLYIVKSYAIYVSRHLVDEIRYYIVLVWGLFPLTFAETQISEKNSFSYTNINVLK